jgi:hypothetical protein
MPLTHILWLNSLSQKSVDGFECRQILSKEETDRTVPWKKASGRRDSCRETRLGQADRAPICQGQENCVTVSERQAARALASPYGTAAKPLYFVLSGRIAVFHQWVMVLSDEKPTFLWGWSECIGRKPDITMPSAPHEAVHSSIFSAVKGFCLPN